MNKFGLQTRSVIYCLVNTPSGSRISHSRRAYSFAGRSMESVPLTTFFSYSVQIQVGDVSMGDPGISDDLRVSARTLASNSLNANGFTM